MMGWGPKKSQTRRRFPSREQTWSEHMHSHCIKWPAQRKATPLTSIGKSCPGNLLDIGVPFLYYYYHPLPPPPPLLPPPLHLLSIMPQRTASSPSAVSSNNLILNIITLILLFSSLIFFPYPAEQFFSRPLNTKPSPSNLGKLLKWSTTSRMAT